jgi:hypothetical protein
MATEDRRKIIAQLPTTTPQRFIEVAVSHFARRGYYLSVTPIEISERGFVSFLMTSTQHTLIEGVQRFNRKSLASYAQSIYDTPKYYAAIRSVLEKEGLTLTAEGQRAMLRGDQRLAQRLIEEGDPLAAEPVITRLMAAESDERLRAFLSRALEEVQHGSLEAAETFLGMASYSQAIEMGLTGATALVMG